MEYFGYIYEIALWGHLWAVPAFLVGMFFFPAMRDRKRAFLDTTNLVIFFVVLLSHVIFAIEVWWFYWRPAIGEFISFGITFSYPFYFILIFSYAPVLLLIWKKLRRSTGFSLLVIGCLVISMFQEKIIIFITGFMRDYQPSSWSYYREGPSIWWYVIPATPVYFALIYRVAGKRKNIG